MKPHLRQPIDFVDSDFIKALIDQGSILEENVIGRLPFEEVGNLDEVIDKDVLFRSTDLLENHEYQSILPYPREYTQVSESKRRRLSRPYV